MSQIIATKRRLPGRIDSEAVAARLESIEQDSGMLTAERVVDDARPPESLLHPIFEWRDDVAAEKFRVIQAEALIGATTKFHVVTDPLGPDSTLPDVCFETDLAGLRLQFAGGLTMDQRPVLWTNQEDAFEDAKNRLLVWRIARQVRIDRRVPADEVVRVTLQDKDGTVLFEGEVG